MRTNSLGQREPTKAISQSKKDTGKPNKKNGMLCIFTAFHHSHSTFNVWFAELISRKIYDLLLCIHVFYQSIQIRLRT